MESKLREKYIKDIISYVNKNFNDDNNNNVEHLVKYIIPYVNSLEFNIDEAIQLLEECPKLVDTISEFRKRNNKFNRDFALLNGYYLITNNDVNLMDLDDVINSLEDEEKKPYLSYLNDIDYVKVYFKEISKFPVLSKEEISALFKKYADADDETKELIKEKIVNHNLKWVVKVAKRYIGKGVEFLDLIEEGNIGLIRAIDKYNYKLGYSFATYATWWIKQGIKRYLDEYARAVRLPVHLSVEISRYERYKNIMTVELGREPTKEELSEELHVPVEKIYEYDKCLLATLYLDEPVYVTDSDPDMTKGDTLQGNFDDIDEIPDKMLINEMIDDILYNSILSEKERNILVLRYGLDGNGVKTLQEVGDMYHLTRERIRQIEVRALQKLRKRYKFTGSFKAKNTLKLKKYKYYK